MIESLENRIYFYPMEIRIAKKSDAQQIIKLAQEAIQNTCINDYDKHQCLAWANRINNSERIVTAIESHYFLTAWKGNELVGFGSLEKGNYIDFLYTHPSCLNKGIASDIYQLLIEKAKSEKASEVTANVSITARPFFEKRGFTVLAEQENKIGNEILVNFKMERQIVETRIFHFEE